MAPERIHPLDDRQAPKEVVGLVQAVNSLLKRLNLALERERRFSADAGQAVVSCHDALINTLMRSLLANAIQYSPQHTLIETRLTGRPGCVSVCGCRLALCLASVNVRLSRALWLQRVQKGFVVQRLAPKVAMH